MSEATGVRTFGWLPVAGHQVYWEESGDPDGIPAVYLHGGPGSGLGPGGYRRRFDPANFRVIGLDQRSCGRSTPLVTSLGYNLAENTTQQLIADLEQLRDHLRIDRWLLNGVSWGCTLALAYAQAHPDRVLGIVVMAVTTTDRFYVDWITETVRAIYPEAWDRLASHAEHSGLGYQRGQARLIAAYATLLADTDPAVRDAASRAWVEWEDEHISLGTGIVHRNTAWDDDQARNVYATLVTHYWAHDGFLTPPLLDQMKRIGDIPATLIHGRRDVSGPSIAAWALHRAWPASELIMVETEGHGGELMVQHWTAANSRHGERLGRTPHKT